MTTSSHSTPSPQPAAGPPAPAVPRGPAGPGERVIAPDLARGLLLLFIVLANSMYYLWDAAPSVTSSAHPAPQSVGDQVTQLVMMVAVDGRSYPMFALLFGYGLVMMLHRQMASGLDPVSARKVVQRRNAWLLVFGAVHAALLWAGDILGAYGLAGLIIAAIFLFVRDRLLLVWAGVLYGLVVFFTVVALAGWFDWLFDLVEGDGAETFTDPIAAGVDSYGWSVLWRFGLWLGITPMQLLFLVVPVMIMVGVWAARRGVLERPGEHLPLLRRVAVVGISVGWLGGLPVALHQAGLWADPAVSVFGLEALAMVTGPAAGAGYVALFGLWGHRLAQRPSLGLGVRTVTAVGRRSLSSYLAQSVLCAPLLAAWGLGWGADLTSWSMALFAIAVWVVIAGWALWDDVRGGRGPAERLLRRLTYGSAPAGPKG